MKSKFIYPTKKNMSLAFLVAQLLPILMLTITQQLTNLVMWIVFEILIIMTLILWELKPLNEMDERERLIAYKWKSRSLEVLSYLIIIPICVLSFYPEIEGWYLYGLTGVPMIFALNLCQLLMKREIGYFFYNLE